MSFKVDLNALKSRLERILNLSHHILNNIQCIAVVVHADILSTSQSILLNTNGIRPKMSAIQNERGKEEAKGKQNYRQRTNTFLYSHKIKERRVKFE